MEDRAACASSTIPGIGAIRVSAVFDGHGGQVTASYLQQHLPQQLLKAAADTQQVLCSVRGGTGGHCSWEQAQQVMQEAVQDTIASLQQQVLALNADKRDGSTLVLALQIEPFERVPQGAPQGPSEGPWDALEYGSEVLIVHIGDSNALFCPSRGGKGRLLTQPHAPDVPVERTRIESHGGHVTSRSAHGVARLQGELAVSRAIGDRYYLQYGLSNEPGLQWYKLPQGTLLLMSDGVTEELSKRALCHLVRGVQAGVPEGALLEGARAPHGALGVIAVPPTESDIGDETVGVAEGPQGPLEGPSEGPTAANGQRHVSDTAKTPDSDVEGGIEGHCGCWPQVFDAMQLESTLPAGPQTTECIMACLIIRAALPQTTDNVAVAVVPLTPPTPNNEESSRKRTDRRTDSSCASQSNAASADEQDRQETECSRQLAEYHTALPARTDANMAPGSIIFAEGECAETDSTVAATGDASEYGNAYELQRDLGQHVQQHLHLPWQLLRTCRGSCEEGVGDAILSQWDEVVRLDIDGAEGVPRGPGKGPGRAPAQVAVGVGDSDGAYSSEMMPMQPAATEHAAKHAGTAEKQQHHIVAPANKHRSEWATSEGLQPQLLQWQVEQVGSDISAIQGKRNNEGSCAAISMQAQDQAIARQEYGGVRQEGLEHGPWSDAQMGPVQGDSNGEDVALQDVALQLLTAVVAVPRGEWDSDGNEGMYGKVARMQATCDVEGSMPHAAVERLQQVLLVVWDWLATFMWQIRQGLHHWLHKRASLPEPTSESSKEPAPAPALPASPPAPSTLNPFCTNPTQTLQMLRDESLPVDDITARALQRTGGPQGPSEGALEGGLEGGNVGTGLVLQQKLQWGCCRFMLRYRPGKQVGKGGFGEVWTAHRLRVKCSDVAASDCQEAETIAGEADQAVYVMKRLAPHTTPPTGPSQGPLEGPQGPRLGDENALDEGQLSGLREVHFGQLFNKQAATHHSAEIQMWTAEKLVRFMESFRQSDGSLWLVLHNEGTSLHALMYQPLKQHLYTRSQRKQQRKGGIGAAAAAKRVVPATVADANGRDSSQRVGSVQREVQTIGDAERTDDDQMGKSVFVQEEQQQQQQQLSPGQRVVSVLPATLQHGTRASITEGPSIRKGPPGGPQVPSEGVPGVVIMQPSEWWWRMRIEGDGEGIRVLLRGLLQALAAVHAANVTHRDVKPENMMMQLQRDPVGGPSGRPSRGPAPSMGRPGNRKRHQNTQAEANYVEPDLESLRLIDFGSAVDEYTAQNLYGTDGPTDAQQTEGYAPPEVRFKGTWVLKQHQAPASVAAAAPSEQSGNTHSAAYDIWGVGVVALELLLGTPDVFEVPSHIRAAVLRRIAAATVRLQRQQKEGTKKLPEHLLLLLRGMIELCILPPYLQPGSQEGPQEEQEQHKQHQQQNEHEQHGQFDDHSKQPEQDMQKEGDEHGNGGNGENMKRDQQRRTINGISWSCTDEALMQVLKTRDPTRMGFPMAGIRLLRSLLAWDASARPSALHALQHVFFHLPLGRLAAGLTCAELLTLAPDGVWC